MRLSEGVYVYPWTDMMVNNCNTYLLSGRLNILIDPGHMAFMERLLNALKADNILPEKIDLIINTHAHPDHSEGNGFFAHRRTLITLHREEDRYLRGEGGKLYEIFGMSLPPFPVEFYLEEGEFQAGDITLEVYHTPGHSPGSICLYWPEKKTLISGDVLFYQGVGRTDIPGADSARLRESLDRLAQLDAHLILPGHGDLIIGRDQVLQNYNLIQQYIYELL